MYDFVQNLNEAKIESAKDIPVQTTNHRDPVNTPTRDLCPPAIRDHVYRSIGPGSSLAFAIGILPGAWDKIPQGVKFDIELSLMGYKENIFSRVLQPKRNIGDRGGIILLFHLRTFSGKTVSIIFITSGSGR